MDRTVEHICFLADVNRLYDNALGLYDLELTLLVAQQSQKVSVEPLERTLHELTEIIGPSGISSIPPESPDKAASPASVLYR